MNDGTFSSILGDGTRQPDTTTWPADMLTLSGYGNVLCQPTTAEESLAAQVLWAMHERNVSSPTLH